MHQCAKVCQRLLLFSLLLQKTIIAAVIMPPPLLGGTGGIMFLCRPSVCVCLCVHLWRCFRNIYGLRWWIFAKVMSVVLLGTEMNWLCFGVKRSKVKVTAWSNIRIPTTGPRGWRFTELWHWLLTVVIITSKIHTIQWRRNKINIAGARRGPKLEARRAEPGWGFWEGALIPLSTNYGVWGAL